MTSIPSPKARSNGKVARRSPLVAPWHKSAPKTIRRCFAEGQPAEGWAAWRRHLRKRHAPRGLDKLLPDGFRALLWGLSDCELAAMLADIAKAPDLASTAAAQTVQAWLDQTHALGRISAGPTLFHSERRECHSERRECHSERSEESATSSEILRCAQDDRAQDDWAQDDCDHDDRVTLAAKDVSVALPFSSAHGADAREADYAISSLAWCWSLPRLASVLPADVWWSLLNHLVRTAMEVAAGNRAAESMPWIEQVLAGELPLTLAYLLPEIAGCRALRATARKTLSTGLLDLLDADGLLHARQIPQMRRLLGCWTRSRTMAQSMQRACWTVEAESQYRRFVQSAMRLARRDGSHVFSIEPAAALDRHLLKAALQVGGNATAWAVAAPILRGKRALSRKSDAPVASVLPGKKNEQLPASRSIPAVHSEWAAVAVLRRKESASPPALTVLFPDTTCRMEFTCGKDLLWSGTWDFEVQVDGVVARPSDEWCESCWLTDNDVDYLELVLQLDAGLRVERHMLLARKDRVMLLADAVLGSRPATLQYRGCLPLCGGVRFRRACETREGLLLGRKQRARVLPLALPEWQAELRCGELRQTADGLELRQTAEGRSLFTPLFFDLDRGRISKPVTWRQLTVAESLRTQPADVAVGYRATVGKRHWLLYRALAGVASRTVLGHNLATEFLLAHFSGDGEIEPLLQIE